MTHRAQRRLVLALDAVLALALVATGAGLAAWPLGRLGSDDNGSVNRSRDTAVEQDRLPLSAYAVIWNKNLQQPLYDPKPAVVAEKPPPKPALTVVGTVIEEGFTYALVKTQGGQVKMARVGQTVDGAEVLVVTADSVTVRFAGQEHVLKVEKERKRS